MSKNYIDMDVLQAAQNRIKIVFDNFEKIYLSFSGGKDSGVMMHLVMNEAIKRNRKIGILFVDLEAQYSYTIEYVKKMFSIYRNNIDIYWICLPLALRNAVSVYQPKWQCWNPDKKNIWVRDIPENCISEQTYFKFFERDMEFEEFVPKFGKWYSEGKKCACFVGIRADESLNRFRTIKNKYKITYNGLMWTTKIYDTLLYNIYPIYDWKTKDIWIYNYRYKKKYNELYSIMNKAGLSIHQQRICQPYGDDQRKGLWLFHLIEPETWSKIVARVNGANSGSKFVTYSGNISGQIKITKPEDKTWCEFAYILLNSMPDITKEHYKNKIYKFIKWYENNGWTDKEKSIRHDIPDEYDIKMEASKKAPSWKRIVKMLLRNDYWAKGLSFSQNKNGYFYKKYMERVKKEREERLNNNRFKRRYGWI